MPAINADTTAFWQDMANQLAAQRPCAGRTVRVTAGKFKGRDGVVIRHQISKYGQPYRYCSDASAQLKDMRGRDGWACWIQFDMERGWVAADKVEVLR